MNDEIAPSPATRPKILLVEDEPAVRRSLHLILHAKGYDVLSFASSAALMADPLLDETICLVTDYRMPEFDGLAVLRALRARGWHKPAILVTAYGSPELVDKAIEEGFSTVIDKPLHQYALADAIERVAGLSGIRPTNC